MAALSQRSKRAVFATFHAILQFAVDEKELLEQNPLAKRSGSRRNKLRPKGTESNERETFTPTQFQNILKALPEQHRPLVWAFALTGLRCSEIAGLQWQDYDEKAAVLHIRRGAVRGDVGPCKTKQTMRDIAVSPLLAEQLRLQRFHFTVRARREPQPADFVFATKNGCHFNGDSGRKHILYPALRRAGIETKPRVHGFHCFRHSASTALVEATGNIDQAKKHLGHADIKTTMQYTHTKPDPSGMSALEKYWTTVVAPVLPSNVAPQSEVIH